MKNKIRFLIAFLSFAICYGAVWSEKDQAELNRRMNETQEQQLNFIKEATKIQTDAIKEQEQIKAQSQRAESPINSSKSNFINSIVVKKDKDTTQKPNQKDRQTTNVTTKYIPATNTGEQKQLSKEEIELIQKAMQTKNLKSLQKGFFEYNYNAQSNTFNVNESKENTIRIRTRYGMNTTIIMESPIENHILGNPNAFSVHELPNMENAIYITPKLIGIDTNLTIFTKDKRIYNFYLFSTDYKANNLPHLIVRVQTPYSKQEKEELEIKKKRAIELDRETYFTIGEGIESLKVKRADMDTRYIQKAKKKNRFLLAEQIFSDKTFTYFKYDKEKMPEMPAVWAVIDKKDSPIPTRVVGDYLVAETTADRFTIRIGDSYVCVQRKVK